MIKRTLDLYYKEAFPRFLLLETLRNGSEYFGPYTSAKYANTLISLIKSLYKLRTCNLSLNKSIFIVESIKYVWNIIGNCMGPCVGYVGREYMEYIAQIRNILKGNISSVIDFMTRKWRNILFPFNFEKAQEMKEAIEHWKLIKQIHDSKYFDKRYRCIFLLGRWKICLCELLENCSWSCESSAYYWIREKLDESKESLLSFAILRSASW